MSQTKNLHLAERWLLTAEEDWRAAEVLRAAGAHAQCCFYCQQAAEKALKAIWHAMDADPWGHSVQRLIAEMPQRNRIPDLEAWLERGALLDKFYIPTRYPNGLPDLTPGQVYRAEDAARGLEAGAALIASCRRWLALSPPPA